MSSTTTIVVPCYNEAARLESDAFESFVRDHQQIDFLFVDDGSTDDTRTLVEQMASRNPHRMKVLLLERNSGKAEAVRQGLLESARQGAEYIGFWDADLATPLDEIPGFIKLLQGAPGLEMVFGSRVNLLGRSVRRNLLRHYVGRAFATAAAAVLRVGIYDTQCGAKLFRVSERLIGILQQPFIGGWIFDVEIIARDIRARRDVGLPHVREAIFEQPLMKWRDMKGSKIKMHDFPVVALRLFRIYWRYLR